MQNTDAVAPDSLRFLALGDSYTIGTSVPYAENFPSQVAAEMNKTKYKMQAPQIIARNGWTTGDLLDALKGARLHPPYAIVTLLIGVNNQYQGLPADRYKKDFAELLHQAIGFAGGKAERVIVLSIPDYSVTPFAGGSDRGQIAAEINAYNLVNETQSRAAGAAYVNVTDISRQAAKDPQLLAGDGLHPSAVMYRQWADIVTGQIFQHL
ncbi:MAG: SGNH/GDSL hydrolase family protein [Mucilaginibacter polytrichastri]|nr:SGNH/GDSL hydrolase family protein [Mucilaginibacter polytrichastri]